MLIFFRFNWTCVSRVSISKQPIQFCCFPLFSSILGDFSSSFPRTPQRRQHFWHQPALCYCRGNIQALRWRKKAKARGVTMWQGNTCNPKLVPPEWGEDDAENPGQLCSLLLAAILAPADRGVTSYLPIRDPASY